MSDSGDPDGGAPSDLDLDDTGCGALVALVFVLVLLLLLAAYFDRAHAADAADAAPAPDETSSGPPAAPTGLVVAAMALPPSPPPFCPIGHCPLTLTSPRRVPPPASFTAPSALRVRVSNVVAFDSISVRPWRRPYEERGATIWAITRNPDLCQFVSGTPGEVSIYDCTLPAMLDSFKEVLVCHQQPGGCAWLPEAQVSITTGDGPGWFPASMPTETPTPQVDPRCCCQPQKDLQGFTCRAIP